MFPVDLAPRYVEETAAAAARLQEQTTPGQYAALLRRAERALDGLFRVDLRLEAELMAKVALRERFDRARIKQALLNIAAWRLIAGLAEAWTGRAARPAPAAAHRRAPAPLAV
jgi:hypothetical protein